MALCAGSVIAQGLASPWMNHHPIFITLVFSAIAIGYGGIGPGLLCVICSLLSIDYFVLNESREFSHTSALRVVLVLAQLSIAFLIRKAWMKAELEKRNAEAAIKARDYLVAIAAHELKTPISAMKLQMELLSRQAKDETLTQRLSTLNRQVSRLTDLVSSLLDVSRINTGRLELHPEDLSLGSVIDDLITRNSGLFRKAGCETKVQLQERIDGAWDRMRLEQVLMNLFSNAIKYGAGKPIIIKAWLDHDAMFSVQDFGIGIAPEDQQRVFDQFERAASHSNYGGLGLGLWIAKQIVEAKGGNIGVKSKLGEGSTFTVRLPLHCCPNPLIGTERWSGLARKAE
jgi:signal transduction histidine kinase